MSAEPRNRGLSQEEDRLPALTILLVFALVGLIGILLVVWAWYGLEKREQALRPSLTFPEQELGPRRPISRVLESLYGDEGSGQLLNEQKRREIESFQWVDRQRRLVAIPIEDAVALLIEAQRR